MAENQEAEQEEQTQARSEKQLVRVVLNCVVDLELFATRKVKLDLEQVCVVRTIIVR